MPKEVIAYQCDYCKKRYVSKGNARRHEKKCIFNPEVKACITCEHSFYKAPESDPGCKIDRLGPCGEWKRKCTFHKYQGYIGIDYVGCEEDYSEDY